MRSQSNISWYLSGYLCSIQVAERLIASLADVDYDTDRIPMYIASWIEPNSATSTKISQVPSPDGAQLSAVRLHDSNDLDMRPKSNIRQIQ